MLISRSVLLCRPGVAVGSGVRRGIAGKTGLPPFVEPFFQYSSDCYITQGIQTGIEGTCFVYFQVGKRSGGWAVERKEHCSCQRTSNAAASPFHFVRIPVLHDTGVPWVASFVLSGVALRVLTAPAHVYAEKLFAKRLHATNYLKHTILKVNPLIQ